MSDIFISYASEDRSRVRLLVGVLLLGYLADRSSRVGGNDGNPPTAPDKNTGLRVSAVLADGGEPLARGVTDTVFAAAQDAQGRRQYITGSGQPYAAARAYSRRATATRPDRQTIAKRGATAATAASGRSLSCADGYRSSQS